MRIRARSLKLPLILALLLGASLALIASAMPWATLSGAPGLAEPLTVTGAQADAALVALSLAALAAAGALAIAGPVLRIVLGALAVLLGACLGLSLVTTAGQESAWFADAVRTATGLSGQQAVSEIVAGGAVAAAPVPAVLVAAGATLVTLAGLAVVVSARAWPVSGRRYSASRVEADGTAAATAADARVDQWDALSDGDDPTEDAPPAAGSDPGREPR